MERYSSYFKTIKKDLKSLVDISAFAKGKFSGFEDIYVPLKLREIHGESPNKTKKEWVIKPGAAVKNYRRMVIFGLPGAGKTSLLKYMALQCCKGSETNENVIPVFIPLREFYACENSKGKSLRDYIFTVFETYGFSGSDAVLERDLESGKFLLLLDGFDELDTWYSRETAAREIREIAGAYQRCKLVVTSRIADYHENVSPRQWGPFKDFTLLEVIEFDNHQIKQFVDNWFGTGNASGTGTINQVHAHAVLKMVMDEKNVRALAKNPLMIAVITAFYDEDHEQLPKLIDLFERIVDVMVEQWDAHKGIRNRFSPDIKKLVLRKLAFQNHCRRRRTMTENDILEEIAGLFPKIGIEPDKEECKRLLEEIWKRSGILKKLMMDTFDFFHLSFQEYFTALELEEKEELFADVIPHLLEPWWEGPILFYTGISKDASPIIDRMQKELAEDIFYSRLLLSGKCVAEARCIDPLLKEEIVQELWQLHGSGEFLLLRDKAIAVLSRIKPRRIIDKVVDQLTDTEIGAQRAAAEMLGLFGDIDVLPALIMILFKSKESKVRNHAALALGKIGSREALRSLIHVLDNDVDGMVRSSAVEALGLICDKDDIEVLSALFKALTLDENENVRGDAAGALGGIGDTEAVPRLIQALSIEKRNSVRWRIVLALGKLGGKDAQDALIGVLKTDRSREVRESAAEALGFIGSLECIPALTKALTSDEEADVRGSAAYALGFMKSTEALPVLIEALITDTNEEVRGRAAYALGQLRKTEAVPYLTAVFNSQKESFIRGNTTYALGQIGGIQAIPFLIQALSFDKDSYVRYRAAEVLGTIGNSLTIQPLKTALNDEGNYYGWKVKDKAFEALEKISRRLQMNISLD
jgi:HEAT repeat protein